MPHENQETHTHPAVLETRVSGLEVTVKGIKTDVASLASALHTSHEKLSTQIGGLGEKMVQNTVQAHTTDWKTLTGFGMLLLAIVGGVASLSKAPIDAAIIRADGDIREMNRQIVPRAEHMERWKEQGERIDRIGRALNEIRSTVQKDLYVPRGKKGD